VKGGTVVCRSITAQITSLEKSSKLSRNGPGESQVIAATESWLNQRWGLRVTDACPKLREIAKPRFESGEKLELDSERTSRRGELEGGEAALFWPAKRGANG